MNKIVNGVANDYEFPQLERITIPTESECYLGIIREYQREVERLNKIINEIEKYFFGELQLYGGGGIAEENYKKIIELKENK